MDLFGHDILILTSTCAIVCAIFTTGVFLQIKIILTLKRDQPMAWEIDVTHSIAMIVAFSSVIIIDTISYLQPTFNNFFGKWYCDLVLFELLFGFFEMVFHSMYISLYKYVFIVHHETVNRIGQQKTKLLLSCSYFIVLIGWTLSLVVREKNLGELNDTVICSITSNRADTKEAFTRHIFSCSIDDLDQTNMGNVAVNILTKFVCTSQSIMNVAVALNVPEIFFYLLIFRHMNRYADIFTLNFQLYCDKSY